MLIDKMFSEQNSRKGMAGDWAKRGRDVGMGGSEYGWRLKYTNTLALSKIQSTGKCPFFFDFPPAPLVLWNSNLSISFFPLH